MSATAKVVNPFTDSDEPVKLSTAVKALEKHIAEGAHRRADPVHWAQNEARRYLMQFRARVTIEV